LGCSGSKCDILSKQCLQSKYKKTFHIFFQFLCLRFVALLAMDDVNMKQKLTEKYNNDSEVSFSQALHPGANPMTVSYNASVVKIYNATSSLVSF
jgi:hypothetical protein